jgi:hypothetical protein
MSGVGSRFGLNVRLWAPITDVRRQLLGEEKIFYL